MKRDAAWLLRRYRDKAAPDWLVTQVLERELQRVIEGRSALGSEMDELRRSAPDRLRWFDEASDKALQSLGERNFDLALREIRKAGNELAELCRFVAVAAELGQVSRAAEMVEALLDSGLANLTTPAVLRRLRDLARQLLDGGEVRKAKFVVLLLGSQVERLRSRYQREPPSGLMLLFDELVANGGAEAVKALRQLAGNGYLYLAERLAEDLESMLAVKDRRRRASETTAEARSSLPEDLAEIRKRADTVAHLLAQWLEGAEPVVVA